MKKRIVLGLLAMLMAVTGMMAFGRKDVKAASVSHKYVRVDADANPSDKRMKVGKYYFWLGYQGDYMAAYYSRKKTGGGKLISNKLIDGGCGDPSTIVTNGKYVFFRDAAKGLSRKNLKNGKVKRFKVALKTYGDIHVYGNKIYILTTSGMKSDKMCVYDMKTRKIKKVKKIKNLGVNNEMVGKGRYLYIFHDAGKQVKFFRYDIKKDKLKTVRTVNVKVDGHECWGYNIYFGGEGFSGRYNYLTNKLTK